MRVLKRLTIGFVILCMFGSLVSCGTAPAKESMENTSAVENTSTAETTSAAEDSSVEENASTAETSSSTDSAPAAESSDAAPAENSTENAPEITGLSFDSRMAPEYAEGFDIYYYEGGYSLIDIFGDRQYLLIPEGGEVPADLPQGMITIEKPLENVYLVAAAVFSFVDACGGTDAIRFSGMEKNSLYIDHIRSLMDEGKILFAGKYSAPDYEALIRDDCDLAIESTTVYRAPEILEMIEELGIPVFIDNSSYEPHALGRTEWIRVYGELLDRQEEAAAFFEEQKEAINALADYPNTGKQILFFFMNGDGTAVIRKNDDYIVEMIGLAGGVYPFTDYPGTAGLSTDSVSFEDLYAAGKDADYIIYNATVDEPLSAISDLVDMNPLFADFKAVQDDQVYTTDRSLFQSAHMTGQFTQELHALLTGQEEEMQFLTHIH